MPDMEPPKDIDHQPDAVSKDDAAAPNGIEKPLLNEPKPQLVNTNNKSMGSTVAKHYNDRESNTKEARKDSRIFHLRNFNNWIKSVIISEYLSKIKRRKRVSDGVNVLDLACGKGGDLLKWEKGKIDHVIMVDIAAVSVDQCKERYAKLKRRFSAEFLAADCTKTRLRNKLQKSDIKLDLTSCQFAFHYSFESYAQADMMLRNLCENLSVGGYFIGTTPDAQKLVKNIKACDSDSFGNSIYNIKPESKEDFPLFGSKYMFYLEGVVDCPEFMVYFPVLEKMAAKYDMKLVWKKNFHDIFKENKGQYGFLLKKMKALEQFAGAAGEDASAEGQYKVAKDYLDSGGSGPVGTLSADEWEVAGLYVAFAFEKVQAPKVEAPKVEAPKVEAHKVEAPKVEAPKVEAPKVEAPKVEAPKVETPKVEAPKVETPKVEAPKVEAPKVQENQGGQKRQQEDSSVDSKTESSAKKVKDDDDGDSDDSF